MIPPACEQWTASHYFDSIGEFSTSAWASAAAICLTALIFGESFNQPVERLQLPLHYSSSHSGKASISLWSSCSFRLPYRSSSCLTSLISRWSGCSSLFNKSTQFGAAFEQPVEHLQLPASLQKLTFGTASTSLSIGFNYRPPLQAAHIGLLFNQPVQKLQLPSSLQQLTLGACFINLRISCISIFRSAAGLGSRFNQPVDLWNFPPRYGPQLWLPFQSSCDHLHLPSSLHTHIWWSV